MNYYKFVPMVKVTSITASTKRSAAKKRAKRSNVHKRKSGNAIIQRVLPLGNAWCVKADIAKDFTVVTTLQSEAIKIASALAKRERGLLIIHNKNGSIKRQVSFTNDLR